MTEEPVREASPSGPIDLRRRWIAIIVGTVVLQFTYWPIVGSVAVRAAEGTEFSPGLLALGLALAPFAFMALAFTSRHPRAATATLKGLGLFILVGLPLIVLLDVMAGAVAGLGAGGAVALRRDEVHSAKARWIAVGVATIYVMVLRLVAVEFALVSGAVLPFAIHGLVDQAAETR